MPYLIASFNLVGLFGTGWLSVVVNGALLLLIVILLARAVFSFWDYLISVRSPKILLEVGFSSHDDQVATDKLYRVLYGLVAKSQLAAFLPNYRTRISLELVSTKKIGVRFLVCLPPELEASFKKALLAYNPHLKLKATSDYLPAYGASIKLAEYKLLARPKTYEGFSRTPYVSSLVSQLESGELVGLQLILAADNLNRVSPWQYVLSQLGRLAGTNRYVQPETDSADAALHFRVSLRAIETLSGRAKPTRLVELAAALEAKALLSSHLGPLSSWLVYLKYQARLNSLFSFNDLRLDPIKLAEIYGFDAKDQANVAIEADHELALPLSLRSAKFDIELGVNVYHGKTAPIGLSLAERERHLLILGSTGSGKTTMLLYAIDQDMASNKGLVVIDPHGDLAEAVLARVPRARIKDVVYLNPADVSHPLGLNLLELTPGLNSEEALLERDFVTESVVSILRKLFSDGQSGGGRLEHILRNAVHTAFYVPDATIFTAYRLLNDRAYRDTVLADINDKGLKSFWANEYDRAGSMQQVKLSIGVTSKLGRLMRSAATRRILAQPKSSLRIDEIINSNKILICNLAKGRIGEDTSSLLGASVLAKLQLAAYARQNVAVVDRSPVYIYVDEFQSFATSSFVQMLSEGRKYKLFLTLAEQTLSQQTDAAITGTLLANVGNLVCFRSYNALDQRLLEPLLSPSVSSAELASLPSYNFYARLSAIKSYPVLSGQTALLKTEPDQETAQAAIESSRLRYGYDTTK